MTKKSSRQNPSTTFLLFLLTVVGAPITNASFLRNAGYDSSIIDQQEQAASASSSFLVGSSLSVVDPQQLGFLGSNPTALQQAAATAALNILNEYGGFTGKEVILPMSATTNNNEKLTLDDQGNLHVRLQQFWMGLPMEGASMVLHFNGKTGNVFALTGQYHSSIFMEGDTSGESDLDCETAVEKALKKHPNSAAKVATTSRWESECMAAAVQGRDGRPYLAYKRLRGYQPVGRGPYQRDWIFASQSKGSLVAVHPTVYGALSLATYNCNGDFFSECENPTLISQSKSKISTSDEVANNAHNYAIDTYNFYKTYFGRDSLDNNGLKLKSYVHYGFAYANAFYAGKGEMYYGDGDDFIFTYLSKGFDVVVHEFSHGITDYTSKLVYQDDSGAMNEAFSDIMAATAERLVKKKQVSNVWLLGEDVVLFSMFGDKKALRNMADPIGFGDPDHYADRLTEADDNGGVHSNSGIMNYAFVLMVQGGKHPKSGISVTALNSNFDQSITAASKIFYDANTKCLTRSSNFVNARECTLMFATPQQQKTVAAAWDAVGVRAVLPLTNGVKKSGLSLKYDRDVQFFALQETLAYGSTVTCTTTGVDGDVDLKVDFFRMPIVALSYRYGACDSLSPSQTEQCTTEPAPADRTKVYVSVEAYEAVSSYSVQCTINGAAMPACLNSTKSCASKSDCCDTLACDGATSTTKTCKTCKSTNSTCTRTSECCMGLTCKKKPSSNTNVCSA